KKPVPNKPESTAPASGASAMTRERAGTLDIFFSAPSSALEAVEFVDVDGVQVAEQQHQDGQPDGRLGRRHGQDEKDEHLARGIARPAGKGHEVDVDGQQ